MKKIIMLFLLMPALAMAQTDSTKVQMDSTTSGLILQEGTIIKAALTKSINGKEVSVGQIVDLELSEDIVVNDKVAVPKGAKITGLVTEAERAKALGRKGKLAFSIDYLYMANGKVIKLRSQIEKNMKSSTAAVVAGAVLLAPVALLIHGKNAKYEKGEVFTAYIDREIKL